MGRFESKSAQGVNYYDVKSKKSFNEVMALDRILSLYSFEMQGGSKVRETYFDTPAKLLERAGITLCKVVEGNKAYFKVERQYATAGLTTAVRKREEKVFIHDIAPNDDLKKHMYYIIDGISSMFSTNFNIDLENVLKTVTPKLDIQTKISRVKVFSGNGFKCYMDFEDVIFKNFENKKTVERLMLKVQMSSSMTFISTFEDFNTQLQRYCKTIFEIHDTKYQLALRLTKPQITNGKK